MKFTSLYAIAILLAAIFCGCYALALSAPHRALPWLPIAYAFLPATILVFILAERKRRQRT